MPASLCDSGFSRYTCLVLVGALFGLSACLAACDRSTPDYPSRVMPDGLSSDVAQRDVGRRLFLEKCASCHGRSDEGRSARAGSFQPPAPDFTESVYRQIDPAYLFWRIEKGKTIEPYRTQGSVMPAWEMHLSEQQIWQLVAFLRSRAR